MRRRKQRSAAIALATAATIVLMAAGAAVSADETEKKDKAATASQAPSAGELSAVKVGKDPGSNELRALTPAEDAALSQELRKAMGKRKPHAAKTGADGTLSLVVGPQLLSVSVAKLGTDGKVSWTCAHGAAKAARSLEAAHTHAPAAQTREEK